MPLALVATTVGPELQAASAIGAVCAAVKAAGVPIVVNGETVGAVGVSGASSAQDAQVATAGVRAVQP